MGRRSWGSVDVQVGSGDRCAKMAGKRSSK